MELLVLWLVSVVILAAILYRFPGFEIRAAGDTFLVVVVLALASTALRPLLTLVMPAPQPWILGTISLLLLAVLVRFAGEATRAFRVRGWTPALIGAVALAALNAMFLWFSR